MKTFILFLLIAISACTASHNNINTTKEIHVIPAPAAQPVIATSLQPQPLTSLPQSEAGGFVLKPGLYETEFKTYCLEPGTRDPKQGDAYLQMPVTGYRKEIVQSILVNSRDRHDMDQRRSEEH